MLEDGTPSWQGAACKDTDPEIFYGAHVCGTECDGPRGCYEGKGETGRGERIRRAKSVCRDCPIRLGCLRWALKTNQPYGVWGGMTERERKDLARKRREQ